MKNTMKMGRRWREKREKREREREIKEKIRFKWVLGFSDHNSCIKRVFG